MGNGVKTPQISEWLQLINKFENEGRKHFSVPEIHTILTQLQSFVNGDPSYNELPLQNLSLITTAIFETSILLTSSEENFTQATLEQASNYILSAVKTLCT